MASQPLSTVPDDTQIIATNELVTGPPGQHLLRLSNISPSPTGLEILDNACGGGIITSLLLSHQPSLPSTQITASDTDASMLAYIHSRVAQSPDVWKNVVVKEADQTALPFTDGQFDYVFNNFGIFFHPADAKTLNETFRVLTKGGKAGFTSWKKISWWGEVALPAIREAWPDAPALPERVEIFPAAGWTERDGVVSKLEAAGFQDVVVEEFIFAPRVEAEAFAAAIAVLVKVVMGRTWSEADREKLGGEGVEGVLLRYLREHWEGGVWDGEMVALVAVGRKE